MIYLDHNASTPADPRVVEAMLPWFTAQAANPSSLDHRPGHTAQQAIERAREQVATLIGARPAEVVFTGGATEADNLAILGAMAPDAELVVSAVEHPAVLEPACRWGNRLRTVPVDRDGIVDPDDVAAAVTPRTRLVSVMAANNETGAIQPIAEIGRRCAEAGVPLHVDAAQAAGRIPIDVRDWHASLVSLSAHKMHGPMGVGALVICRTPTRVRLQPVTLGGGQERGLRPGTLNLPAIVGFGAAARLAPRQYDLRLRERLLELLRDIAPNVERNGPSEASLPQTLSVRFPGINARGLLRHVADDLALATGSACSTTSVRPSHVLLAMGRTPEQAFESVRVSFGPDTTMDDLQAAAYTIRAAVERLRTLATVT